MFDSWQVAMMKIALGLSHLELTRSIVHLDSTYPRIQQGERNKIACRRPKTNGEPQGGILRQ